MKYTKQIRFICLLMLCSMLISIFQPAAADIKAERLLKRMGNLTPIQGTNLLIAQESKKNKWGLYDTDANIIIPLEYEGITYLAYNFLNVSSLPEEEFNPRASIPLNKINCHALMTLDGSILTEYVYGTFIAYSPQWFVGWVLGNGTSTDYDFALDNKHFCRIRRCDIYYCGEEEAAEFSGAAAYDAFAEAEGESEAGQAVGSNEVPEPSEAAPVNSAGCRLVLSLTRDEFKDAAAHGDYLFVQSREGAITVYNKNAEIIDIGAKNLKSSMFGIKNWMIVDLATGEMVMDGCTAVKEVQTENGLLLLATRIDFQGNKLNSLITTKGEVIIPMWDAVISSVSRDYAIITSNANGKKGLYSRVEKRMILPCAYDDIIENKNGIDRYNCHGYVCVMKDEQYYCYEVETGKLLPVVELKLGKDVKLDRYGATFFATSKVSKTTTTQLVSPDGKVKSLYCTISKTRGSGYLLIAKFAGGTTVINWYGNNYLLQYYSKIIMTDDDRFILKTKNSGYELYRVPK